MGRLTTAIVACLLVPAAVSAQARIEKNVIYGMYSGLALLMDVHRPETPNGAGIIFVAGRPNGTPHPELPNALDEMVRWLNQYLKGN